MWHWLPDLACLNDMFSAVKGVQSLISKASKAAAKAFSQLLQPLHLSFLLPWHEQIWDGTSVSPLGPSFWSGKYQGVGILGYPCAGDVCTYGLIKREGSSKRWASKKFPGTRNRLVNNGFPPSGWNEDPEAPEGIMWIVGLNCSIKNFTLIGLGGHAITGKNAWNELIRMDYELSSLSRKSYCSFLSLMRPCLFVMQCWVATFSPNTSSLISEASS